jgi:uncharacterized membrane protein YbaN (DUF454 family)
MSAQPSRSEAVVEDYKKHKLKRSALCHIRNLLHSFEQERAFDRKLAWVGLIVIVVLVSISWYWFSSTDTIIVR